MKNFKLFILSLACASSALATDIKPGELEGLISKGSLGSDLVLTGAIDARDFAAIEHLPSSVKTVDLSGVKVERLALASKKYFGRTLFVEGEMPEYSFFKSGVEKVVLPIGLKSIGDGAFAASTLKSIVIPEGVESIGDYAFYGSDLESIVLPSSLTSIGKGAFGNCHGLKEINLASTGVTELPERVFAGDVSLTSVKLPAALSKVGREAFSHTAISSLDLSGVDEFEPYALSGMPWLEKLDIAPDATVAEGLLMDDISLVSLSGVPANIPDFFAANCNNEELNVNHIVASASSVGKYALANLSQTTEMILGAGVTRLQRGAFSGMSSLKSIDVVPLDFNIPEVDEYSFEGIVPADIILYTSESSYNDWKAAPYWSEFNIQIQNETNIIGTPSVDDGLAITYTGGLITVKSVSNIAEVRLFSADGRQLMMLTPGTDSVEIDTSALPRGVTVIVAVTEEGQSKNVSLLL